MRSVALLGTHIQHQQRVFSGAEQEQRLYFGKILNSYKRLAELFITTIRRFTNLYFASASASDEMRKISKETAIPLGLI